MQSRKHKIIIPSIVLLLAFVFIIALHAASAADQLAGHWEAEMQGDGKTFTFVFEFKVNGISLGGTVELSTLDREFPITDGKIDGNSISFKAFGIWTGTLQGNELSLTRELDGGKKQRMKAHRSGAKG